MVAISSSERRSTPFHSPQDPSALTRSGGIWRVATISLTFGAWATTVLVAHQREGGDAAGHVAALAALAQEGRDVLEEARPVRARRRVA
jgi:hypothetical protein